MAVHLSYGVESGVITAADHEPFDFVDAGAGVSMVSVSPMTGSFMLRANITTTASGYWRLGRLVAATGVQEIATVGGSPFGGGCRFRATNFPGANNEPLMSIVSSGAALAAEVRVSSAGILTLHNEDSTVAGTGTRTLTTGTEYYIEMIVDNGSGGACTGEVRVNGVTEITTTTGSFGLSDAGYDILRIGKTVNRNGQSVDWYFDDMWNGTAFLCAATETSTLWPRVIMVRPIGAGNYSGMAAGTGSSGFAEVNETPPSTAQYIRGTANGQSSTFDMTSSSTAGITGTIHNVLSLVRQLRNNASATVAYRVRSQSTDFSGTAIGSATTTTLFRSMDVDPGSGSPWTTTSLDQLEVGAVIGTFDTNGPRVFWVGANVLFSPAAAGGGGGGRLIGGGLVNRSRLLGRIAA